MFVFRFTVMTIMSMAPTTLLGALQPHLLRCKQEPTFPRWGCCGCVCLQLYQWKTCYWCFVDHLQAEFQCVNPRKLKKKNYQNSGVISIKQCQVMFLKWRSVDICIPPCIFSISVGCHINFPLIFKLCISCFMRITTLIVSWYIINIMATVLGPEGVYLSGLYHGGLSNQLHCEYGNIKHKILF